MVAEPVSHVYLKKANNDLVSHCKCPEAFITFPPQMDCPWCGCGWLFTCIKCRMAFTFAEAVMTTEPWEEIARRDLLNRWKKEPATEHVSQWVEAMKELLHDVKVGAQYVCLDGRMIPTTTTSVRFDGWHSRHDLAFVPQVAALRDKSVMTTVLSDVRYWKRTAIAE